MGRLDGRGLRAIEAVERELQIQEDSHKNEKRGQHHDQKIKLRGHDYTPLRSK